MFKSYSSKSKSVRGAHAFAKTLGLELSEEQITELVHLGKPEGSESDPEVDLKWGFYTSSVEKLGRAVEGAALAAAVVESNTPTDVVAVVEKEDAPVVQSDDTAEESAPSPFRNVFGGMAAQLDTVASRPTVVESVARNAGNTGYTIEKNRPEQNGIKRPSTGTLCRLIWDTLDAHTEAQGTTTSAKQLREMAKDNGWDNTTGTIQFYRWRRFNGITGRAAKAD